jgi:hypothetical protein
MHAFFTGKNFTGRIMCLEIKVRTSSLHLQLSQSHFSPLPPIAFSSQPTGSPSVQNRVRRCLLLSQKFPHGLEAKRGGHSTSLRLGDLTPDLELSNQRRLVGRFNALFFQDGVFAPPAAARILLFTPHHPHLLPNTLASCTLAAAQSPTAEHALLSESAQLQESPYNIYPALKTNKK